MWRVRLPDGSLSDMVNRTRAKDAAISITLQEINRPLRAKYKGGHSPSEAA
jgi:hypothetical protein